MKKRKKESKKEERTKAIPPEEKKAEKKSHLDRRTCIRTVFKSTGCPAHVLEVGGSDAQTRNTRDLHNSLGVILTNEAEKAEEKESSSGE